MEVSVVTPTYNRRAFIPTLLEIYRNQTFPKERMEWIIIDDGYDCVKDLFEEASKTIPNIRYVYRDEKMRIGAKRNELNRMAQGDIIIAMDDDDYYPADRVSTVVEEFRKNPSIDLAGSSEMYLYYQDTQQIYVTGPYGKQHATNGTMAWRKRYAQTHVYDEYVTKAEEQSFLDNYIHPMIQLDPKKTILVICHEDNTVDKRELRDRQIHTNGKKMMRLTTLQIDDIVKEIPLKTFYKEARLT